MRWLAVLCLMVLAACGGGEAAAPEVSVDASWSGDTVEMTFDTNLPDGAVISWGVLEDPDDLDTEMVTGFAEVAAGSASATADVSTFTGDEALVEAAFVPGYTGQPDHVAELFEANQGASAELLIGR